MLAIAFYSCFVQIPCIYATYYMYYIVCILACKYKIEWLNKWWKVVDAEIMYYCDNKRLE